MTQVELKMKYKAVQDKAKMFNSFAEATGGHHVTKENCITMERLAREAYAASNALLSACAGNEDPKTTRG